MEDGDIQWSFEEMNQVRQLLENIFPFPFKFIVLKAPLKGL